MEPSKKILSEQETRITTGNDESLTTSETRAKRGRISRMLKETRKDTPQITVERARLLTESFQKTERKPVVMRWALALKNILSKIDIHINADELIVGRCSPPGLYGILYPELRGAWLEKGIESCGLCDDYACEKLEPVLSMEPSCRERLDEIKGQA